MKQDIGEVIINFINNNQHNNWDAIFKALLIFLGVFWIGICLWIFIDSRTRYKSLIVAILITLFVLVFNIPALIIYVILRPEHTREEISLIANAASSFQQSLPIEVEKELLNSKGEFKMHFALNFTPSIDGDKPKISFSVENSNELPLSEDITKRKTLTESVEVIDPKKKELEQKALEEKILANEELKLSEQLVSKNIGDKKEGGKLKKALVGIGLLPKRVVNKVRSIKIVIKKPKFTIFSNIKASAKKTKEKLFPRKAITPTEVILPKKQSKQGSSEKLAKSKKKKKNRNRRG